MLQRLVHTLQILATPADEQLARLPDLAANANGLALDFADALLLASDCPQLELTPELQGALERVDGLLQRIGGRENTAMWTEPALREAAEWVEVRRLAAAALRTLGASAA